MTSALAIALVSTACGAGVSGTDEPLVIYSGRTEELVGPLIEQFENESEIDVEVRYADSSEPPPPSSPKGRRPRPMCSLRKTPPHWASRDLMSQPGRTLELVDSRLRDRDGRWIGTSGRVRVFVHNTSSDLPLPQTIDDAVDPAWAGQLGVAPTNGSFLAFVSAMILERGEDATREWLEALAANDPVEFDGNAPIVDATDTGELAGAWSTITTCCVCGRRVRAGTPRTTSSRPGTSARW